MTPTKTKTPPLHYGVFPAGVLLGQAFVPLCNTWNYTLTITQNFPSRMAMVKNALGNSVDIWTAWQAPVWPDCSDSRFKSAWCSGTVTGPLVQHLAPNTAQNPGAVWLHSYTWTVAYATPQPDPGTPFNVYDALPVGSGNLLSVGGTATWPFYDANSNPLGSGGVHYDPIDLVGNNANNVNWGMLIFSSGIDDPNGEWFGTPSIQTKIISPIDTSDTGDVSTIETALQLFSAGGVACWGSTPTRKGLDLAIQMLQAAAQGTSAQNPLTDDVGQSWTNLPPDPRINCGRKFFDILVTDGISNFGNPGGCGGPPSNGWGNWPEPCLACDQANCAGYNGGPGCPDGGPSGSTCPDDYTLFPAGKSEEAWNATFTDPNNNVRNLFTRTWVIGISKEVGPCELNATAYYGRTDANAPQGDGGYQTALDPRLPGSSPGTFQYVSEYCNPAGVQPPYAFFATDPTALQNALNFILRASLFGDFVTSGPTVATSYGGVGSLGMLASSAYPGFQGHLYAYDVSHPVTCATGSTCPSGGLCGSDNICPEPDTYALTWDAGQVLSQGPDANAATSTDNNNSLTRHIYTWDGNQLPVIGSGIYSTKANSLVEVTTANQGTLDAICGSCGFTNTIIDFVRGNDGNGNPRNWALGGVWNSTPAIVGAPEVWTQFNTHIDFETAYKNRHPLVWVGTSDGMVHAFDIQDGAEILALIPPDMLARQVTLYNTYKADPVHDPVGQSTDPTKHVFGPASSIRFADIWDPTMRSYKYPSDPTKLGGYRTVMFITEGAGGHGIHAVDVTHAWWRGSLQHDPYYGYTELQVGFTTATGPQVMPLWTRTQLGTARTTSTTSLSQTWSIPAVGAMNLTTAMNNGTAFQLVMGRGFRPWYDAYQSTTQDYQAQPTPYLMRFNALTGNSLARLSLTSLYTGSVQYYTRNQTLADGVIWGTSAPYYRPDNDVNQGVVADYHGQVWLYNRNGVTANWNNPTKLPDAAQAIVGNPIYYSPAVAPYPAQSPPAYLVYAFGSGSFYESSALVTGAAVGTSGNFIPALYFAAQNVQSSGWVIKRVNLQSLTYAVGGVTAHLSGSAQLTTSPLLLTPAPGLSGNVIALFSVYDPNVVDPTTGVCGGSYLIQAQFNPGNLSATNPFTWDVALSGAGASAGFALGGSNVPLAAMSTTVSNSHAYLNRVTGISVQTYSGAASPVAWWMELQ